MNRFIALLYLIVSSYGGISQTANFTYQSNNGLYCEPSVIQFSETHTGSPLGFVWTFGDGTSSNSAGPQVIYTVAGSYTVRLQVIYQQTTVEVTKTIVINPSITASIGYDRNYICIPGVINFTAGSNGNIASYQWDFGDGSPAVTTTANNTSHNYTAFGSYYPVVKLTDISGCFATATVHVVVEKPLITPIVSPTSGCIPANISFSATVLLPTSASVTSYVWNFGDGSPAAVTTVNNITHSYTVVGTYLPTISITTNEGCTNSANFHSLAFGIPPTNLIAYPKKLIVCGSETPEFVSKAVNANTYTWDFGDGTSTTVTDTIISHRYSTLGTKTITVTPLFNGCPGTPANFTIDVIGVIAGYTYANTCSNPKQYSFTNISQGNLSSIDWDFGDTSPHSNALNTIHSFPVTGTFATVLIENDNITGCADTFTRIIYTADPSLVNPDVSICKNSNTSFTILNNYTNSTALYTWHVAGMQVGPTDSAHLTVNANILGNFVNYVVIDNGPESCPDTVQLNNPLLVRGPNVSFSSPDDICLGSTYTVTNTSSPFLPADTIKLYYWNFGSSPLNDTTFQPLPYAGFPYAGTWDINLYAIDKNGCRDSLHKILTVNPKPFLHSVPGSDSLCLGQTDTLIAFHSGNILWSPANLVSCATCDTVIANPTADTNFYITATNSFGCTAKDSVLVKVFNPFTAVVTVANNYTCMNDPVQLNVGPPLKKVLWSPATGLSRTGIYNPVASPLQNTIYTATLTDSAGCFSSSVNVNVYIKTLPVVDAGPDKTSQSNANFSFTPTYSSNVMAYAWTPATQLNCTNCAAPDGIATHTQTYTVTVTSDSGCIAKDNVTVFVDCKDANLLLPAAFTPNDDKLNDYFYPLTTGVQIILRFSIYNRQGQLIFEAKNFEPNNKLYGWDGNLKGRPQAVSAYVYDVEAICETGQRLYKKGSVLLIR